MEFKDAPEFVKDLSAKPDYSAKALMMTILCAVRTNETIGATWSEFDLDNRIWTIPAERMKAGVEHRVPLSTAAMDLLPKLHRIDGNPYVFPGAKRNKPLSNMAMLQMLRGMRVGLTVHGFRSTFHDWASETTLHPDTIAEMALAHTIKNKTERAYRRGDAFQRRQDLMQQWCDYLLHDPQTYRANWDTVDRLGADLCIILHQGPFAGLFAFMGEWQSAFVDALTRWETEEHSDRPRA